MVRFATAQLRAGHVPLDSWFPFLGLGSPQFLHYQSLPAMLAGLAVGPGAAFGWSLYLLLALWPISVYRGARLLPSAETVVQDLRPEVSVLSGHQRERCARWSVAYLFTAYRRETVSSPAWAARSLSQTRSIAVMSSSSSGAMKY
jgi:hypothetical protein